MKALLLLILLLLTVQAVSAQETPIPADWTTEQRCITAPSVPPDGWAHDGVIFTFERGDGVHAHRADVATSYYVAFDSNSEFAGAGSLSPDGRLFAVPMGRTSSVNMNSDFYLMERIRVYSTSPERTFYDLPITDGGFHNGSIGVPAVQWIDNGETLVYGNSRLADVDGETEFVPLYDDDGLSRPDLVDVSPDESRLFHLALSNGLQEPRLWEADATFFLRAIDAAYGERQELPIRYAGAFNYPLQPMTRWTPDSSRFAAWLTTENSIGVFSRDGELLDEVPLTGTLLDFDIDMAARQVAFVENGGTLHLADFETRRLIDTCIDGLYSLAFSPDGRKVAFDLREAGWIYILDTEAWQAYRIDLAAADVIGWYAVE